MDLAPGQPDPNASFGLKVTFTEVYQIEADFKAKVESEFSKMIEGIVKGEA
jgi:hypothetical protein